MSEQPPRLVVTRRAAADIRRIYRYTFAEWGEEQADSYAGHIWNSIQMLLENP